MSEAQMIELGEHAGVACFWASPDRFDEPGFYIERGGRRVLAWTPVNDVAGASVDSVKEIPWEPGVKGISVEFSNGVAGAFQLRDELLSSARPSQKPRRQRGNQPA